MGRRQYGIFSQRHHFPTPKSQLRSAWRIRMIVLPPTLCISPKFLRNERPRPTTKTAQSEVHRSCAHHGRLSNIVSPEHVESNTGEGTKDEVSACKHRSMSRRHHQTRCVVLGIHTPPSFEASTAMIHILESVMQAAYPDQKIPVSGLAWSMVDGA